jgi:hypothetical protein
VSALEVLDISSCRIPSVGAIRSLSLSKSLTTLFVGGTPLASVLSKFSAHLRNLFPHVAVVDGSLHPPTSRNPGDGLDNNGGVAAASGGASVMSSEMLSIASASAAASGAGSVSAMGRKKRNARHRRRMEALELQREEARDRRRGRGIEGAEGAEGARGIGIGGDPLDAATGSRAGKSNNGAAHSNAEVHTKPVPRESSRSYAGLHKMRLSSSPDKSSAATPGAPSVVESAAPVAETLGLVPPSARKAAMLSTPRATPAKEDEEDPLEVTILQHDTSVRGGGASEYLNFDEDEFGYMDNPFDEDDVASQEYEYRMRSLPWRRPPDPIPRGWLELHVTGHGLQDPSKAGFGAPPPPPPMALTVNGGGFKPVFKGSRFFAREDHRSAGGDGARHLEKHWNTQRPSAKAKAADKAHDRARATPKALSKSKRSASAFPSSPSGDSKHLNNRLWKQLSSNRRSADGADTLASTQRTVQTEFSRTGQNRGVMGSAHDNGSRVRGASVANIYSPRASTASPRSAVSRRFGGRTSRRSDETKNLDTPRSVAARSIGRKIGFGGGAPASSLKSSAVANGESSAVPQRPARRPKKFLSAAELEAARKMLAAAAHSIGGQNFAALLQRVGTGRNGVLDAGEFLSMVRQMLNLPAPIVTDEQVMGVFRNLDVDNRGAIDMREFLAFVMPPDESNSAYFGKEEVSSLYDEGPQQLHRQFSPLTVQSSSESTSLPGRDVMQPPHYHHMQSPSKNREAGRASADADMISEISHSQSILQQGRAVDDPVTDEEIMRRWPISPSTSGGAGGRPLDESSAEHGNLRYFESSNGGGRDDHATNESGEEGAESNTSLLKILKAVIAAKRETIRKLQEQQQDRQQDYSAERRGAVSPNTAESTY